MLKLSHTVCLKSVGPFYIASHYIKMDKTSWTYIYIYRYSWGLWYTCAKVTNKSIVPRNENSFHGTCIIQ